MKKLSKEDLSSRTDTSLLDERVSLANEYNEKVKDAKNIRLKLTDIKQELRKRRGKRDTPYVTEHAVIRFLERVYNIDIESIKEHIETRIPIDRDIVRRNGIKVDNMILMLSKDGKAITTIMTEDMLDEGAIQEERATDQKDHEEEK